MPNLVFAAPQSSRAFVLSVKVIDAGATHTLAIQNNRNNFGWGQNTNGGVGDNTTTDRFTPISISGAKKTFCFVSGGNLFSVALDLRGRVWSWGLNTNGRLGDNSVVSKNTPVSICGAVKTFCVISTGFATTTALDLRGRAWGWGLNTNGVIGDNSAIAKSTPVSVVGAVKTFCKIVTGGGGLTNRTLAITNRGRLWAWGENSEGGMGDNSIVSKLTPVSVCGAVKTFCEVVTGPVHSMAIDRNGRLWSWGGNGSGQLGINSLTSQRTPVSVLGATKTFCKIAVGLNTNTSYAIDRNGRLWAWGLNTSGALGDNSTTARSTPVSVCGAAKTFCEVSAGLNFGVAIDRYGDAWAWGVLTNGQLGIQYPTSISTPKSILGAVKTFSVLSTGLANNSFKNAIDKNGIIWSWGFNNVGQLGINSTTSRITPTSICGAIKTFCKVSTGSDFALAVDKNGRLWSWGFNNVGQLGDNSVTQKSTPVSVCGAVKTFCHINTGSNYSLGIDKNGRLWGWGYNNFGQLGINSITSQRTPVSICGAVKTFCSLGNTFGQTGSGAIDKNGRLWMWGLNTNGMLGNNSTVSVRTPVSVCGAVKTFCKLALSYTSASYAIDKNGIVWAWGFNGSGGLGDNTTTNRSTPVSLCGAVKTFCEIASGDEWAIALDKNGRAWGWGYNGFGQLGINIAGIAQSRRTPVSVCGAVKTFCKITAGVYTAIAIDKNGRLWSWGSNGNDLLAQGLSTLTPVRVCVI